MRTLAVLVALVSARGAALLVASRVGAFVFLSAGGALAVVIWLTADHVLPRSQNAVRSPRVRARAICVVCVFAVAMLTSVESRAGLSTMIAPDTAGYWMTPTQVFAATPRVVPIRTPFYSWFFAFVQLVGGGGRTFLALQFACRGLAAAAVAWVLSRSSLVAGAAVGLCLALDPVSAAISTAYLTESVFTSGLVLGLALAVAQLTARSRLRPSGVFVAGLCFGCGLLVRPTSAALIALIVLAYLAVSRSIIKSSLVGAGYVMVALFVAVYNYARTGLFVIVATGIYVAFPLFVQHLMDPGNGRASRLLSRQLELCYHDLDYARVTTSTANTFVYTKLLPCTLEANGGDRSATYRLYAAAYREAILAHPAVFASRMLLESSRFLAIPVSYYPSEVASFNDVMHVTDACLKTPPYRDYPPRLIAFVCPVPRADPTRRAWIGKSTLWLRAVYQPYFYSFDPRLYIDHFESTRFPEMTGATGLLFFVLAVAFSRPMYRPLISGAAVVILYNAAVTAFGQVTLTRYVAPLSPFFLIITCLLCVSLVEDAVATVRFARAEPEPRSMTLGHS